MAIPRWKGAGKKKKKKLYVHRCLSIYIANTQLFLEDIMCLWLFHPSWTVSALVYLILTVSHSTEYYFRHFISEKTETWVLGRCGQLPKITHPAAEAPLKLFVRLLALSSRPCCCNGPARSLLPTRKSNFQSRTTFPHQKDSEIIFCI